MSAKNPWTRKIGVLFQFFLGLTVRLAKVEAEAKPGVRETASKLSGYVERDAMVAGSGVCQVMLRRPDGLEPPGRDLSASCALKSKVTNVVGLQVGSKAS